MQLKSLELFNFRCFEHETINFQKYNALLGSNNSGKSTILHALDIFFGSNQKSTLLKPDDFRVDGTENEIRIKVTFGDLTEDAQQDFQDYFRAGEICFLIKAQSDDEGNVKAHFHGVRNGINDFRLFFEAGNAAEKKEIYKTLQETYTDLPNYTSAPVAKRALNDFEAGNPELTVEIESPVQAYGVAGPLHLLNKYLQWVYIPAVKDAAEENFEAKNSAFKTLINRAVRSKIDWDNELQEIKNATYLEITDLTEKNSQPLSDLQDQITTEFQLLTSTPSQVKLNWSDAAETVNVAAPNALATIDDQSFEGDISHFGHGLQRNYLIALLNVNAKIATEGDTSLLLACEEPELYQHPPQARFLSNSLKELSDTNQVILTTHSPLFITARELDAIRVVQKDYAQGRSAVHSSTLQDHRDRISTAKGEDPIGLNASLAALHQHLQPVVNELFFARHIVLVEGPEDEAVLKTMLQLKNLQRKFDQAGAHIVRVDGKQNLINAISIAKGFNIPHFVVFDADTDKVKEAKKNAQLHSTIFSLLDEDIKDLNPENTLWLSNAVVWPTSLTEILKSQLPNWEDEQTKTANNFGGDSKRLRKNPIALEATLTRCWTDFETVDSEVHKLCELLIEKIT